MSVPRRSRAELAAEVARLRAGGHLYGEVAARLGISTSYAHEVATDPNGTKRRALRDSYDGTCGRCGGVTKSDGTSKPSRICSTCSRELQREAARWTPETVIAAIRRFARAHGRPPASAEWQTADRGVDYPATFTVQRVMGSWANAIEAAGYPRPRNGVRTGAAASRRAAEAAA